MAKKGFESDDKWRSTARADRKRKPIALTLPPETLERLEQLAKQRGESRSEVVEAAINLLATKMAKKTGKLSGQ